MGAYEQFSQEELILRDLLAIDRTVLANERTFLAYIRTALAIFLTGVSLIKFIDHWLITLIGWAFIPISGLFFVWGGIRYYRMKRVIEEINTAAKKLEQSDLSINQ